MKSKTYEPLTHKLVDISELMKLVDKKTAHKLDCYFCEWPGQDLMTLRQFEDHLNEEAEEDDDHDLKPFDPVLNWLVNNKINYVSLWIV